MTLVNSQLTRAGPEVRLSSLVKSMPLDTLPRLPAISWGPLRGSKIKCFLSLKLKLRYFNSNGHVQKYISSCECHGEKQNLSYQEMKTLL